MYYCSNYVLAVLFCVSTMLCWGCRSNTQKLAGNPRDAAAESVGIIFDTDMLTDFDDVGALACLHALADAGECRILATVSSTRGNASVGAIEVINAYYGRGDLPVGAPKGMGVFGEAPGAKTKVDPKSPLGQKGCEMNRREFIDGVVAYTAAGGVTWGTADDRYNLSGTIW